VAPQQTRVTLVALLAQFRLGGAVEPSIKKIVERDPDSLHTAAEIALT
jgi:hypothetical protein